MMYFSINSQGFYPDTLLANFEDKASIPSDLKEISDEDYNNFFNPPNGYYSVFDDKGPRVEKLPEPDYVSQANSEKKEIINSISSKISVYQTKLLIGRKLTDEENSDLNGWLDYSDKVNAVDTSTAPNITWPTSPDDESTT
ncbi:hypothetical protein WB60_09440 [bacteria symbiont BFo2 of Frankliniella occidentalis]|nr:hypothetical protein WB60_09440 [bacteria symbiont BFo2 of Frankliniella occidentalis]